MLRLFNSLGGRKEAFSAAGSPVTMYVCGVTPYDTTHAGHAFTYAVFDTLQRYLRYLGHQVRYVRNVTDVDDSILQRARERGLDYKKLGEEQSRQFHQDMRNVNMLPADHDPLVSDEIPGMVEMIRVLLGKGAAYVKDGWVYFRVGAFAAYGQLCCYDRDAMIVLSRERGADPADPRKEDGLDFILWQPSLADEPSWPAPWGAGRPGWHIECSAMSLRYLGDTIDIHGGGADLIYPHHESEIAQSETFTGKTPFARFWMHVGMVRLDGVKMSKSRGNLVLVRDLLRDHSAAAIRMYLLSAPYRQEWDFDRTAMPAYDRLAERVKALARPDETVLNQSDPFLQALDDDLNVPAALDVLRLRVGQAERGDREAVGALSVYASLLGLGE